MTKYRELRKLLIDNGFEYIRNSKGSHERWMNYESKVTTTLTRHSKDVSKVVEISIRKTIERSNKLKGDTNE